MIPPSNTYYFNTAFPPTPAGLHILFLWRLDAAKSYKLQYTSDGVNYSDAMTITNSPSWSNMVPATTGQLWPRIVLA